MQTSVYHVNERSLDLDTILLTGSAFFSDRFEFPK